MDDSPEPALVSLQTALVELKEAAARRRMLHRGTAEHGAALAYEVHLSQRVYELAAAVRNESRDR
jgi:hypothetical protein